MELQNWRERKMKLSRRIIIGESYSRIAILPNVMTASSLMPLREEIGSPVRVNLPGRNARWAEGWLFISRACNHFRITLRMCGFLFSGNAVTPNSSPVAAATRIARFSNSRRNYFSPSSLPLPPSPPSLSLSFVLSIFFPPWRCG